MTCVWGYIARLVPPFDCTWAKAKGKETFVCAIVCSRGSQEMYLPYYRGMSTYSRFTNPKSRAKKVHGKGRAGLVWCEGGLTTVRQKLIVPNEKSVVVFSFEWVNRPTPSPCFKGGKVFLVVVLAARLCNKTARRSNFGNHFFRSFVLVQKHSQARGHM